MSSEWKRGKLKYLAILQTGNSISDSDKDLYSEEIYGYYPYIATKDIDVTTNKINYDNGLYIPIDTGFKIANKNTILLCIEGGSAGRKIGYLDRDVCYVNKLCNFKPNHNINSRYLYYSLQSYFFTQQFNLNLTGIIPGVSVEKIKNMFIKYPDIHQQQKIANFLDEKVSQIDTIIEKTKQSIEELKKYKQSLIAETVTKGLDPNVEMKDSGIEWVGEIPKHWEIRRLRDISIITRGTVDKSKKKNEIPVYLVQYTNVYYKREQKINDDDYLPITVSENEYKKYKVRKGDILLTASSETKDDIGHSTVIVEDLPNHVFGSDIIRIRIPNKIVDLNYKKYFMENYYYLAKFDKLSRGITRFRFGMDQFKSLKYVIPPIEEQVKIAKYLDNITNHINQLICNKEKLINELESYKKSLIYEYVTGKKEVM